MKFDPKKFVTEHFFITFTSITFLVFFEILISLFFYKHFFHRKKYLQYFPKLKYKLLSNNLKYSGELFLIYCFFRKVLSECESYFKMTASHAKYIWLKFLFGETYKRAFIKIIQTTFQKKNYLVSNTRLHMLKKPPDFFNISWFCFSYKIAF